MTTGDAPAGRRLEGTGTGTGTGAGAGAGAGDARGPSIWLVHNPRSRSGIKTGERLRAVTEQSDGQVAWRAPESLEVLAATVAEAMDAEVEILVVHGGDGTLHRVLSALVVHLGGGEPGAHLKELRLPRILLLPAGTVNIVAGNLRAPRDPVRRLRELLSARAEGGGLEVRTRTLTVVNGRHAGFIFGTGGITRTMDAYYDGGTPSIWTSARVIGRGTVSALVGGAFARDLFRLDDYTVTVDGERWPGDGWGAVCTGTVRRLALGFAPFYTVGDHTDHLHVIAIRCGTQRLGSTTHNLWLGRPTNREGIREAAAREICLEAAEPIPFNMDGDCYPGTERLLVQTGPMISFVVGR